MHILLHFTPIKAFSIDLSLFWDIVTKIFIFFIVTQMVSVESSGRLWSDAWINYNSSSVGYTANHSVFPEYKLPTSPEHFKKDWELLALMKKNKEQIEARCNETEKALLNDLIAHMAYHDYKEEDVASFVKKIEGTK